MMKLRNLFVYSALLALLSGCNTDELVSPSETDGVQGNEIRLIFSGGGESQEYARAIASESENQINNLDIYVFAATSASDNNDDYQLIEVWKAGNTDDTATKTFKLNGAGISRKASIFPTEYINYPYLKLYCVANCTQFYDAAGANIVAPTAATIDATGTVTSDGTTATVFEGYSTAAKLTAADTPLATPLVMTGSGTTKILGNIATVNIELKRRVSRFDIDNESAKTGLIIESITVGGARNRATVMPAAALWTIEEADKDANLTVYPTATNFLTLPRANTGTAESALYTYPISAADEAYLIIKGKYQNPTQQNPVPVEYELPIQRTTAGAAAYIDINANTRYTLHITEVMEATISSYFEIVDWTSGGGVIIKPDNAAPEVTELTVEGTAETDLTKTELVVTSTATDKTIKIVATASGQVNAVLSAADGWPTTWLTADAPVSEVKDGVTTTTLTFTHTVEANKVYAPITLTLKNESASEDESVYTKLTIVPPAVAATLSFTAPDADATGNYNTYDDVANTINMYKTVGSSLELGVSCPFGTTAELTGDDASKLELTKRTTAAANARGVRALEDTPAEGDTPADAAPVGEYYTLTVKDITAANCSIKIVNAQNPDLAIEIPITFKEAAIGTITLSAGDSSGATYSDNVLSNVPRTNASTVKLTVPSQKGVTASTISSWYSVATGTFTAGADGADGTQEITITVADKTDFPDTPLVLKNKIAGGADVTITVKAAAAVAP